eukprot:CAMPEP_0119014236 /NCGR_PEP_ID=MMETSP1176-20130426/9429_1 /TAXON_ID=265551 /ORGANISM="Synedropsis recta cf, Strain CCMP1620" /LENGTH=310 /DNA_ID=CAMNT_0006967389 /DNA_START=50 /DNA_END=982 /DNA_ORIENTATION=-
MRVLVFASFVLLVTGVAHAKKSKTTFLVHTTKKPSSALKQLQMISRGGAGPLDPALVAKAGTVAALSHGFLSSQAPETSIKLYKMKKSEDETSSAVAEYWARVFGTGCLATGVAGFCLFFKNTSTNTAVGWMNVVWIAEHLRGLLSQEDKKFSTNPAGRTIWLVLGTILAHACFTNADYVDTAMKTIGGLTSLACSYMVIDPKGAAAMYEFKEKDITPETLAFVRCAGFHVLGNGIFTVTLGLGVESTKAFGLAFIAAVVQIFSFLFVTNECDTCGIDVPSMIFWLLFDSAVAATLALPAAKALPVSVKK